MANSFENAERRQGAISALRELLRQGLDVEASCQVEDWQDFLTQALKKLMAAEIVDLLPWVDLAVTRKNKKSLESQNQRGVIDLNCFYMVLVAHIAVGFSSKQKELVILLALVLALTLSDTHTRTHTTHICHYAVGISKNDNLLNNCLCILVFTTLPCFYTFLLRLQISKAKTICECLVSAEGSDLKLEDTFCLFLLGQVYMLLSGSSHFYSDSAISNWMCEVLKIFIYLRLYCPTLAIVCS